MNATIQKWGNSLGIRIPKNISDALHLNSGSVVEITIDKQTILIKNHRRELDDLLENITESNIHKEEFDDDTNHGKEIW